MTNGTSQASNRRSVRNVLVNRPLQREFTLFMIAIMVTAGVTVGLMIHLTLAGITDGSPSTISRLALERMILDVDSQLVLGTIFIIFIAVMVTGLFGIFFLHRVAGPVYRFKMVFKQIASGQVPRHVKLRDRDFFKETATELNQVITLLRQYDDASNRLEEFLSENQGKTLTPDLCARLRELKKHEEAGKSTAR